MVYLILIAVRRPCALMLHGLLRVFPVLRRPGRARTLASPDSGAFGCADRSASQALSNAALRARVHYPAASTPLAPHSVRGAFGQKNPPRTAEKQRLRVLGWCRIVACTSVGMGCMCFSAEGGGFFRLARSHAMRCEGCGGGGCEKRCRRRVFQGLQRRLNERSELCRRRCEPDSRHRNTVKTRSSTCSEASTGVAPRLILFKPFSPVCKPV